MRWIFYSAQLGEILFSSPNHASISGGSSPSARGGGTYPYSITEHGAAGGTDLLKRISPNYAPNVLAKIYLSLYRVDLE